MTDLADRVIEPQMNTDLHRSEPRRTSMFDLCSSACICGLFFGASTGPANGILTQILMMMFFLYSSHMKNSQTRMNESAKASEALYGDSQAANV